MKILLSPRPHDASADVVVVAFFDDRKPAPGAVAAAGDVDVVAGVRATPSFRGTVGDAPLVIPPGAPRTPTVVVVGVGSRSSADAGAVRTAALKASAAIRGRRRMATSLGQVGPDRAESYDGRGAASGRGRW